jgi:hypothetical protein
MSNKFYTYLTVSGPNAATAEKAAIEALKAIKPGEYYRACWIDADTVEKLMWNIEKPTPQEKQATLERLGGPCYFDQGFDHASGEGAIKTVAQVSHKYPSETFMLSVTGDFAEGIQGRVFIEAGQVTDERTAYTCRIYYIDADGKDVTKDAEAEIDVTLEAKIEADHEQTT